MTARNTPHDLWREAHGNPIRYLELMREAGHIVDRCPHRDGILGHGARRCDREAGHPGGHTFGHDVFGHRRS